MECKRCLLSDDIQGVVLNETQCNYCDNHDKLETAYPIDEKKLESSIAKIKKSEKNRKYDCLIGISGGTDSSYMLHLAAKYGLRVLAFHYDNGWNTEIAESNMKKMTSYVGCDFIRIKIAKHNVNKINRDFLNASVSEADIPNDIAMGKLMTDLAIKFDIKWIFNGHDFRSEGSCPIGWTYMDGKYIQSVSPENSKHQPLLSIKDQIISSLKGIKNFRPLYYTDYDKPRVKLMLKAIYDWEDYGGHHCENIYTAFVGNYLLPKKFKIDKRRVEYSALIRGGKVTKEEAKRVLEEPLHFSDEHLAMITHEVVDEFTLRRIMEAPIQTYNNFETYHASFKKAKPLIWVAVKFGLLPLTFYQKYTK